MLMDRRSQTTAKDQGDFHGDVLISRDVAGFVLRETVHEAALRVPRHSHEHAHVAFVLRGNFIEQCERTKLECQPLSVSYLAPGMTHSDDFRNGAQSLLIEIAPQRLAAMRELLTLTDPFFVNGGVPALLLMRLYAEARQGDTASSFVVEGLTLEVLAEVARWNVGRSRGTAPAWLDRVREFLHANFSESPTHDEVAATVGVHPVHVATVFRRYHNCTLGEYVRRLRVEYACRQIAASADPLVDIAYAAGFSDQSHFSNVFRQYTGMTPSGFRANVRRSDPSPLPDTRHRERGGS